MHEFLILAGALAVAGLSMYGIVINVHYLWITREKTDVKKEMITDLEKRLREALKDGSTAD